MEVQKMEVWFSQRMRVHWEFPVIKKTFLSIANSYNSG
jgi:hypothetical protein